MSREINIRSKEQRQLTKLKKLLGIKNTELITCYQQVIDDKIFKKLSLVEKTPFVCRDVCILMEIPSQKQIPWGKKLELVF